MACAPGEDSDQSEQSSLCAQWVAKDGPKLFFMWTAKTLIRPDAQADMSVRWAHKPFCRFCHALAHRSFYFMFQRYSIRTRKYISKDRWNACSADYLLGKYIYVATVSQPTLFLLFFTLWPISG